MKTSNFNNAVVTYKTSIIQEKPYPQRSCKEYLSMLEDRRDRIFHGYDGLYLSRCIKIDNDKRFFLFIDVDGKAGGPEYEKITSAITNLNLTVRALSLLGVMDHFKIIATGGTGFRLISNILVSELTCNAFTLFIKEEMPQIIDLQPSKDISMPHQLLVYKGVSLQNRKNQPNRHSVHIPVEQILNNELSPEKYLEVTEGNPNPSEYISFMEWFFDFKDYSNRQLPEKFGARINLYEHQVKFDNFKPFTVMNKKGDKDITLEAVELLLKEKQVKFKDKGDYLRCVPCPVCNKSEGNASVHKKSYSLKCFRSTCPANNTMPISKWAGISVSHKTSIIIPPPDKVVSLDEANQLIRDVIRSPENSLCIVTPGTGKSHIAQHEIANMDTSGVILYSAPNIKLQKEAYEQCKGFAKDPSRIHLLESKEVLCEKKSEFADVISLGYFPSIILCGACSNAGKSCKYYEQRNKLKTSSGVYFITHGMLKYLDKLVPNPELIILDEDLLSEFKREVKFGLAEFRTILNIKGGEKLTEVNFKLIEHIDNLANNLAKLVTEKKRYSTILNSSNISGSGIREDTIISLLAYQNNKTTEELEGDILDLTSRLGSIQLRELYKNVVNYNVIKWLNGLVSIGTTSYIEVLPSREINFKIKILENLTYPDARIKILDATGHKAVVEQITRRKIEEVKIDVYYNSKNTHIPYSTYRENISKLTNKKFEKKLKQALKYIKGKKVLILTYNRIKDRLKTLAMTIDPTREYYVHHFHGPRGINDFKDCDGVIVFGLPYPNLLNIQHDAYVCFPHEQHEELRSNWPELSMNWELTQCIHRIRPVRKPSTDIVVIATTWPSCLKKADLTLPVEHTVNLTENIISRLDSFVQEFGFLTREVICLFNICMKEVTAKEEKFKKEFFNLLSDEKYAELSDEKGFVEIVNMPTLQIKSEELTNQLISSTKVINPLYIYRKYNLLSSLKSLNLSSTSSNLLLSEDILNIRNIINLIFKQSNNSDNILSLSSPTQYADILNIFCEKYPHLSKFKIKSPLVKNQVVKGIGNINKVKKFYLALTHLGLLDVNLSTLSITEQGRNILEDIPDKCIVVFFSEDNDAIHVSQENVDWNAIDACEILTNNGKRLWKLLIADGIQNIKVHDLNNREMMIRYRAKNYTIKDLADKYALPVTMDTMMSLKNMYKIWQQQEQLIKDNNLQRIINLENEVLPILAAMEDRGILTDIEKLREYIFNNPKQKTLPGVLKHIDEKGVFHDNIRPSVTTGRQTSKLHNIKKDCRVDFKARKGYKFIIVDYKSQEPRVLAHFSNDLNMLEIFRQDKDIYNEVMKAINSLLKNEQKIDRDIAKTIVNLLHNGGGVNTIIQALGKQGILIEYYAVQSMVNSYFMSYPGVRQFFNYAGNQTGRVVTGMGRTKHLDGTEYVGPKISHLVQGNAADIFKVMLVRLNNALSDNDAHIIYTHHDSIMVEVREDQVVDVEPLIKQVMESTFESVFTRVKFPVEIEVRDAWGELPESDLQDASAA